MDIPTAIDQTADRLDELLEFSKSMFASIGIRRYLKQITIYRLSGYSAMFQRAKSIVELVKMKQGKSANVLMRSMWEIQVHLDYVTIPSDSTNLMKLLGLELKHQKSKWDRIQTLRTTYRNSDTWQKTIPDTRVSTQKQDATKQYENFVRKYPSLNLGPVRRIEDRVKAVDDHNLAINPTFQHLYQMDYATVYNLLSDDTHATIWGGKGNVGRGATGYAIKIEDTGIDSLRVISTTYDLFLDHLQYLNRVLSVGKYSQLVPYKKVSKDNNKLYMELEA